MAISLLAEIQLVHTHKNLKKMLSHVVTVQTKPVTYHLKTTKRKRNALVLLARNKKKRIKINQRCHVTATIAKRTKIMMKHKRKLRRPKHPRKDHKQLVQKPDQAPQKHQVLVQVLEQLLLVEHHLAQVHHLPHQVQLATISL